MPPVLRKRKAPEPAPAPAPPKKKAAAAKVTKAAAKVKEAVKEKASKAAPKATPKPAPKVASKTSSRAKPAAEPAPAAAPEKSNGTAAAGESKAKAAKATKAKESGAPPVAGDVIDLEGFGGEIETNDGTKTTLKALVDESKAGVVLFTYPKASTPGCTKQACLFRDSYEPLTAGGLAIYGLSADSPKANTTFKQRQSLPYRLLCDPAGGLIAAIGMRKAPRGTTRGVFVVDKAGKVLAAEPGSPDGTVAVVRRLVEAGAAPPAAEDAVEEAAEEAKKGKGGGGDDGDEPEEEPEAKEPAEDGKAKDADEKAGGDDEEEEQEGEEEKKD